MRIGRRIARILSVPSVLAVVVTAGCATGEGPPSEPTGGSSPGSIRPEPAGATAPPAASAQGTVLQGSVSTVVDGDTIKVVARGFETTVRLVGIDTPETRKPGAPVQCFARAATGRTKRLLPVGQPVRLVSDPSQAVRDRYGRFLAYVYKPGRSALTSVNYSLVATGYAKVFIFEGVPFRYARAFRAAESGARKRAAGLWGPPCRGDTSRPEPSPANTVAAPLVAAASAMPSTRCDPGYRGACVPSFPPDVDCHDLSGAVTVVGRDPHRLDGDGDGSACE